MGPTAAFLLHFPSSPGGAVCGGGGGGETLFLFGTGGAPPPWEFEREQVVVPSFSLHFTCSTWHWVSFVVVDSQQACTFSSILNTVKGQCTEANQSGMSVSNS